MRKKLVIILVMLSVLFTAMPVSAAGNPVNPKRTTIENLFVNPTKTAGIPVVYKRTIVVTADGGRYQVGFVNIEFKKEFINKEMLPVTIEVEINAENGVAGIELTPSMDNFCKMVIIRVDSYKGLLYDEATGKNIFVNVNRQQLEVDHFSRHAFS